MSRLSGLALALAVGAASPVAAAQNAAAELGGHAIEMRDGKLHVDGKRHRTTWKGGGRGSALQQSLRDAVSRDGTPAIAAIKPDWGSIVLVQWWAGWCTPCLKEAKDLGELFASSGMQGVQWITVEADPTQAETPPPARAGKEAP